MIHLSMMCRAAPLALLLMAGCEPARTLQPAASPVPAVTLSAGDEEMLERLLLLQSGGRPVDPKVRSTYRQLLAVALANPRPPVLTGSATTPSPAAERALRELQTSPGTTADMQRILLQYMADERAARDAANSDHP
ncbi:hypothetical protein [Longimicrobium terrae]|uniref:Uncharacterized protein n=1 Tax=Longimicrobium terrae TaxID=1639882 RepID=A0A841H5K4_9BACT|nr:hypothetical protein [Longimicrobium terrae]MBB4639275.1 hypothetical protein [Longimicrobium terrae]MBB6073515.1 hypothetical protein [Longimicrobium terrae]NNC32235.1 hypothetical protein [Longimicrobium terrae]